MFIYIIVLLILLLIIKDFTTGFRFKLSASLDYDGIEIKINHLYPLLKITVEFEGDIPFILVHLFKARLYKAQLIKRGHSRGTLNAKRLYRSVSIKHVNISASFGFHDPFYTSIIFGTARIVSNYVDVKSLNLLPDFLSTRFYFLMNANANLYLGHSIINYIRNKS